MYLKIKKKTLTHDSTMIIPLLLLFLITSCAPIATRERSGSIKRSLDPSSTSSSSRTCIDLFVMSQCPYGVEAEKEIISVIKEFWDRIDFHLYFIAEEADAEDPEDPYKSPAKAPGLREGSDKAPGHHEGSDKAPGLHEGSDNETMTGRCHGEAIYEGGRFKSLHGKAEIEEDIRQTVIARYYPQRFLDYLLHRAKNYQDPDWEQAAVSAWIDCDRIKQLVQDKGEALFLENIQKAKEMNINASPALFMNGKRMQGPINRWSVSRNICKESYHPQSCQGVPVCGQDFDCRSKGRVGVCLEPDTPGARCRFTDPVRVKLEIIKATDCPFCDHSPLLKRLKELFPGIEAVEIDLETPEGKKLIRGYSIQALPAYLFDPNIQNTARYSRIKGKLQDRKDRFLLSQDQIRIFSLVNRPLQKDTLSLFTEGFSPPGLMAAQRIIQAEVPGLAGFRLHLLAGVSNQKEDLSPSRGKSFSLTPQRPQVVFKAPGGLKEIQEDIRQLCILKHFSHQYLPYLECITSLSVPEIEEGRWQDCLNEVNLAEAALRPCTHGKEGVDLLLGEIELSNQLGIKKGPSYLINNKVLLKEAPPELAAHLFFRMNARDGKEKEKEKEKDKDKDKEKPSPFEKQQRQRKEVKTLYRDDDIR